ncbi:MAG: ceramidase domain-containing protein, partial [Cyclobacteriaceae bacterium]|nr:ceramidase domain-containing protein [Cyclobacteriaceae bacterium]MCK5206864.1 ceramidase domain-containing protein [Cyclobacteriaceae bacterium]
MNSSKKKENIGYLLLAVIAVLVLSVIVSLAPIEQDQTYHNFSDIREFLKIPNFWNVISNLPFLIVGVLGVYRLRSGDIVKNQFIIFFIGIAAVSFGSAYYHLNPNNETLVWDRLPMTIGFMALFSALVSEYINDRFGKLLLIPALTIGLSSVLYWVFINDL